jgi:predicted nucleic acid-binding protein
MNGQFFDTNVIVYAHDPGDPRKQGQARATMHEAMVGRAFVISTQVMQEFHSVSLRRQWMSAGQAADVLRLLAGYRVVPADAASVLRVRAAAAPPASVWDALIVQAAIDARCGVLYSEDLQAGLRFDAPASPVGALRVVNPFDVGAEPAVHEP